MIAVRFGACLVSAALIVGACGGDDDDTSNVTVPAESPTTTSTTVATTTTTEDPKVAVEQAFFAKWDAYVEVGANPDPANPLVEDVFTGPAKQAFLDAISRLNREGNGVRRPSDSSRFVLRVNEIRIVSESEAVVFECSLDGLEIFDLATGEVKSNSVDEVASRNILRLVDGVWKVEDIRDLEPGDPTCDDF